MQSAKAFSSVQIIPDEHARGVISIPIKNIYKEKPFTPNSVYDVHPDSGAGKYRYQSFIRYNNLREEWEIHPYFIQNHFGNDGLSSKIMNKTKTNFEIQINLNDIVQFKDKSIHVIEIFFDNVQLTAVQNLVNIPNDILQVQGNVLQYICVKGLRNNQITFKLTARAIPPHIIIHPKSYCADNFNSIYKI